MKIITNNQPRALVSFSELPIKARADFGYIEESEFFSPRFFKYKNAWHDTCEFMRAPETLKPWYSCHADTFFSGTLVRYVNDFEQIIVGSYFS